MKKVKKLFSVLLAVAMLTSSGVANIASAEDALNVIYVSAISGDDANTGTLAAPLKTIDAAKLMARELSGDVTVEIMEGEYRISSTVALTEEDSNVTYKAYGTDTPEIKGSVEIPATAAVLAKDVTDETTLAKMTANAQEEAYVINLADYGVTQDMIADVSNVSSQYGLGKNRDYNVFYVDGNAQTLSQWPNNKDYAQHVEGGSSLTSITYADDYCDKWAGETGFYIGMWAPYDYSYFKFGVTSVDADANIINYVNGTTVQYSEDDRSKRWKAYNLLSEMDVPGEYYIDRDNLKLYFYPTSNVSGNKFELDIAVEKLFTINGADNVTFDGLTFTQTSGYGLYIIDVDNVDIRNCTFSDIGYVAVAYGATEEALTGNKYTDAETGKEAQFWQYQKKNGSYNCDIENNIFKNIGSYALTVGGAGDIDTLTDSNNFVRNNLIYNASSKSALYGMSISGCGVVVEHNNISKVMMGGIYLNGNNHTVQYNEIYNCMTDSADAGAIYQGRADVFRGSRVQYNYIHDMVLDQNITYEGLKPWQTGIYWDDGQTGMFANNNIFKNIRTAFNSNHAGDYEYKFNTAVECEKAWSLIDYPHGEENPRTHAANGFTLSQLQELIVYKDLYYEEYENLQAIAEEGVNPRTLNVFEGNLRVNSGVSEEPYNAANATFTNNQVAGSLEDTVDLTTIFVDPANQDYRVKNDSAYATIGVLNEDFDIDLIGIQTDVVLNAETAEFEMLYPAKGANIGYQDEYNFTWTNALGANNYKLTIATDENFEDVVFQKETIQQGAVVTGLTDETIYYCKIEAENTSRELASTWLSTDGVYTFGVNASLYEDTEKPAIPENFLTENAQNVFSSYGYNSEWKRATYKIGTASNGSEFTWNKDDGVNWPLYPVGYTATTGFVNSVYPYEAGKSYVVSAMVKDSSLDGGQVDINFTSSMKYTNTNGTACNLKSLENQAEKDYTIPKYWSMFANTIVVPDDFATGGALFIGTRPTFEGVAGSTKFVIDDVYFGEEIAYDIDFKGSAYVSPAIATVIDADLVNQGGVKGSLSQDGFTFIALDETRTEIINGITVTPSAADSSVVMITVDESVEAGTYVLVAETNGIKKGLEIKVVDSFADTATNEGTNIIPTGADGSGAGMGTNSGGWQQSSGEGREDSKSIKYTATADSAASTSAYWCTVMHYMKTLGTVNEDDRYLVSAWAKDVTEDETLPPVKFFMSVKDDYFTDDYPKYTSLELTDEWHEFYGIFTVPAGGFTDPGVYYGYPTWEDQVTGQAYLVDDFYFGKEVASDIEINGAEILGANVAFEFDATVLNQLDKPYSQDQSIEWIVTNKERTAVEPGFVISGENGNITLTADSSVATGEYSLVALSNGLIKGIDFTIISAFEDSAMPETPANFLSDRTAGGNGNYLQTNSAWGLTSYADGKTGTATIFQTNKDVESGDTNWKIHGGWPMEYSVDGVDICLKGEENNTDENKAKITSLFEANKNYVVSYWVRDGRVSEDLPYTNFTSLLKYNGGRVYSKEYPEGTYLTLTDDWQEYKATFKMPADFTSYSYIAFGHPTTEAAVANQSFIIDDLYISEEAVAEINITTSGTKLTPVNSIDASVEVLNQVGLEGELDQSAEWFVVTEDRSTVVDGINVEETATGVTLSLDGEIESGKYALVAITNGLIKGTDIYVMSDFADTEAVATPANFLSSAAAGSDGNKFQTNSVWSLTNYDDGRNSHATIFHATEDAEAGDANWPIHGGWPTEYLVNGVALSTKQGAENLDANKAQVNTLFKPNTNYVVSYWVRDGKLDNSVPYTNFTSYLAYNGGRIYTNEYPQGNWMTLTDEWQNFAGVFNMPADYTTFSTLAFGHPTAEAAVKDQAFIIDDLYIAEEVATDIKITTDNTRITPQSPIEVTGEVVNQVGIQGTLDQDIEWYFTTADRKSIVDGATITETADGIEVSVAAELPAGKYALVAVADDMVKGIEISVITSYEDTAVAEKSNNILSTTAQNCGGNGWLPNSSWGYTAYADGRNGGAIKIWSRLEEVGGTEDYWKTYGIYPTAAGGYASAEIKEAGDATSAFEAGKNYVVSCWAKDIKEDESVPNSKFSVSLMHTAGNVYTDAYPEGTSLALTDEWQEYKGVMNIPDNYAELRYVMFGYPTWEDSKEDMAFAIDDAYIAEEVVNEIVLTSENTTVSPNAPIDVSLQVLNQIGTEGYLEQDAEWYLVSEDRSTVIDGAEITKTADGVTLAVGEDIAVGNYALVAIAGDVIKGISVTVAEDVEVPEENIASAVFEQTGTSVNFKATIENVEAENIFFVIAEFNGSSLVQEAKSVVKAAADPTCDLTLEGVTAGNTVRAFIWNNGTLLPIDNANDLALEHTVAE